MLPLLPGITDLRLADAAIDLARMLELSLCTVRVLLPEFLEARDADTDAVASEIGRRSRLYGLRSEEITLEGNPVRELIRLAQPSDLWCWRVGERGEIASPRSMSRCGCFAGGGSCLVYTQSSSSPARRGRT